VTYFGQYFRSPHFSSQGIKRLYWQKSQGKWKIVGQEWNDHQDVLREHYLADSKEKMKKWLLHWKKAWEAADLALYRSFYHQDARQNSRQGVSHIASFKRRLWQQERPKDIVLDDITILMHPRGFEINFLQTYHGRRGYSDNGHKELITQPQGDGFVIVSEMWNSISEN
jgi:murein L,D-transpeptidase YafK